MISELLTTGRKNARTASELAIITGLSRRDVCARIEQERREGQPICAGGTGYYIADGPEDLDQYCKRLKKMATSIFKTRQALIKLLEVEK